MSGGKIVTDFKGFIQAFDCGETIFVDPNTDPSFIRKIIENEEDKKTA